MLLALHEIWPEAPLYTAVYDPAGAPWAKVFDVRPSFLQHFPFAKSHHELYPWLTPLAFQSFNFDEYDVVLSVTSAEAKNIITKPHTLHICYCLTPTRYLWSGYEEYQMYPAGNFIEKILQKTLALFAPTLKGWDMYASTRPDYYISISQRVSDRIKRFYVRRSEAVIYPPVDLHKFRIHNSEFKVKNNKDYFLVVSRLVGYKRIDIIVDAFNTLGWPLVVIGDGVARKSLEMKAFTNIRFVSRHLTDAELARYYQDCRAFIYAGDEDFGIVAAEAQACGKPVVAYGQSGVAEIILSGKTGELFFEQTPEALTAVLEKTKTTIYDGQTCRKNVMRFSAKRFEQQMKAIVFQLLNDTNTI